MTETRRKPESGSIIRKKVTLCENILTAYSISVIMVLTQQRATQPSTPAADMSHVI